MGIKRLLMKKWLAFTLIETVVVIGVIGLVLPVLFTILFVILQQQSKLNRLQQVKKNGDFVLSILEKTIKNRANSIYENTPPTNERCGKGEASYPVTFSDLGGSNFYFLDKDGNWFRFYLTGNKIASSSAGGDIFMITDLTKVDSFDISCDRSSAFSPATVSVNITISFNTSSTRVEDTASLTYRTRIKMKNY